MSTSKLDNLDKRLLCKKMIEAGFKNSVIEFGTGITNSMVRAFRKEIGISETSGDNKNSGQLRIAARIVDNRRRIIDAGIIIRAYLKMAKDPTASVDFNALIEAHKFYKETHIDIYGRNFNPIDVNEAFVLVRDFRSPDMTIQLHSCNCGTDYITVAGQKMVAGCPACSLDRGSLQDLDEDSELDEGPLKSS